MIRIEPGSDRGRPAYIFRAGDGLGDGGGSMEQWYAQGDRSIWPLHDRGIPVENEEVLMYASIAGLAQGVSLGRHLPYGFTLQERMYDVNSSLTNGSVLTVSKRREFLRKARTDEDANLRINPEMPEHIVAILAETKERVLDTARKLSLPLEAEAVVR